MKKSEEYLKEIFDPENHFIVESDFTEYGRLCVEEYKAGLRSEEAETYIDSTCWEFITNGVTRKYTDAVNNFAKHVVEINSQHLIDKAIYAFEDFFDYLHESEKLIYDEDSKNNFKEVFKQKLMENKKK